MLAVVRRHLDALSWFHRTILLAAVLFVAWSSTDSFGTLPQRVVRDSFFLLVVPLAVGIAHGRRLGWRVNRRAVRNALLLSAFVTPFYVVGSTLPTIREFYPMWGLDSLALSAFLPHAVLQLVVVLAVETYYRGLLCVGIRDRGPWVILISPLLYAYYHLGSPPIEVLLSGPTDALFGVADYDAGSILPSVVAHGFGLVLLDFLVLRDPVIDPETTVAWLEWLPVPL